jgi:hypothetical protein
MKNRYWSSAFLVLAALLPLWGCGEGDRSIPGGGASAGSAALADTLRGLIEDAYDFTRPGVVERMNGLYARSGRLVSASAGSIVADRDSIERGIALFWENVGQNMRNANWRWGDVFVDQLGEDGAVLTASWSIPHTAPTGEAHEIAGAWTAVFRRMDSGWRIVQEHLSAK